MRSDEVWSHSRGAGVTVAVLDSGVDATHPDLAGRIVPGAGFVGIPDDTGQTDPSGNSHGTSVASIIAATGPGMTGLAPEARILPLRVSRNEVAEPIALAKAIIYAADHQAGVVNISLGVSNPDPNIRAAVDYALGKNVVVVAAAGNEGLRGNGPMYPAAFPGVVNVTGVDRDNKFWEQSESGPSTTLAAPAVDILSAATGGTYRRNDGTSYAAPYVSAAAALLRSHFPDLSASAIVERLTATADRVGSAPHDDRFGAGVVNPLRALTTTPSTSATTSDGIPWWLIWIGGAGLLAVIALGVVVVRRRFRHQETT